jgi:serine/threonine protein kinase
VLHHKHWNQPARVLQCQLPLLRFAAHQLLSTVAELHVAGYVHRDIKPEVRRLALTCPR